mmetsp:Transcript_10442/g.15890  ORF Transcript_10442/g.15890 Transcript_10442/m.15890 type:complete len:808 (+) Transcript_10442:31-2454(+)
MSSKKKKSSKKSSSHQSEAPKKDEDISLDGFKVLFQGKRGVGSGHNRAMVNSADMAALRLSAGSIISIEVEDSVRVLCRAWPSTQTPRHSLTLSRFWRPNFDEKMNNRSISIATDMRKYILVPCVSATLHVEGDINLTELKSMAFRSYLSSCLADLPLLVGTSFFLFWRSNSVCFRVLHGSAENASIPSDVDVDSLKAFMFSSTTDVHYVTTADVDMGDDSSTLESPSPTLPPFGGYSSQLQEAQRIISSGLGEDITTDLSSSLGWLKRPRGLLIHGPRGCGKTLMMRYLAALYSCGSKCNVETLSHDVLLSRYQGEAEATMQRVFASAHRNAPSLILMDDIDLLCGDRSKQYSASDVQRRVVSCLLTLVEGVKETHTDSSGRGGVFILATSSCPQNIDSAMRRPGRLDREIELPVPTPSEREEIISRTLMAMDVVVGEDGVPQDSVQAISRKAHGMVGADLLLLCKEAALIAVERNGGNRGISDLSDALESMSLSTPVVTPRKADTVQLSGSYKKVHVIGDDLYRALALVKPTAIREVAVEVPEIHWHDIGGMDTVKQSLREVVEWPLQHPELFLSMGVDPPKGVLLYGPPGCSKTLMAKALATESGLNFLTVRGPELLSKWLGDSEKAVQKLFQRARASAPSLIFFDEIDAFACKRGDGSSSVNDRVLSQLLTEIDGVQGLKRVVVVAATNRPDMLDSALMRPGRIDRKIYVPPPDNESRKQIFCNSLKTIPTASDIDVDKLVFLSDGFSGAEVVATCTEAAVYAVEENCDRIEFEHLLRSVQSIKPQITASMISYYQTIAKSFT